MRKICLTLLGCLCLLIQGYCDDTDDDFFFNEPEELFRVAIWDGNVASCKALLETGQVSEDTVDQMFFNVLFENPEFSDKRSVSTRIALGQLLAKYLSPDKDSWFERWIVTTKAVPVLDPEIWKILTSSIAPQYAFYPKCFLVNCIVRKQCYETYSDYPQFLDQLLEDYDIDGKENELSSFLPQVEVLQAYIDFCNANNVRFASTEEVSQFIETTYIPTVGGGINVLFSGFLPVIDDDLGFILNPTTKTNLLMDFFRHQSLETADLESYHLELPLLYFTDRFFEKKPLCQLDPKVVVERILRGIHFKQLAQRRITNVGELRSIYAWYHLLNAPEVQEYIQQLPDDKKKNYQEKIELLINLAKEEGCDRDNLLSLFTQKIDKSSQYCFEFFRDHLSLFKGGTIDWFSSEENKFTISLISHALSEDDLDEFFEGDFDDDEIECFLRFIKVEVLQFDGEDDDLEMTISDLRFDGDNQMTINYFVEGDPNPRLLKVKAKKILCELL